MVSITTPPFSLLDVTLRDGSYAINYQYTAEQAGHIAKALDRAGIHYIEVSHGCGLGAKDNLGMPGAASDAEYVAATRKVVKRAKIGVIAGPAPTTQTKDIDAVIDQIDFIRFAANCDTPRLIEKNLGYVQRKRPNLEIFLQLMRSSRCSLERIRESVRIATDLGIKVAYLVDTAGHFQPDEVFEIVKTLVGENTIGIGFHGHNNLGLANANTLAAIHAGAISVDASLRGIGRGAGNAQLESLVSALKRFGQAQEVSFDELVRAGTELIEPIMPSFKGISALDLLTAHANIDLYPLSLYEQIAQAASISLPALIEALGADTTVVEVGPKEVKEVLKTFGKDPDRIFEDLGLLSR